MSSSWYSDIYRIIIFPVVLFGCETWSLILSEDRKLRVYEKRVSRRIFRTNRDEQWSGEKYTVRCLMICTAHPIWRMIRWAWPAARMVERIGVKRFGGDLRERDRLENPDVDGRIIFYGSSGSEMRRYELFRARS
jgi:hypothetical protein